MHFPSPYSQNLDPTKTLSLILITQFVNNSLHSPIIVLPDEATEAARKRGGPGASPVTHEPDVTLCQNFRSRGISAHGYPLNTAYPNLEHQSIYLAPELRAVGIMPNSVITGVSIKAFNPPGRNLENVRIASAWVRKSEFSNADGRHVDTQVVYGPENLPENIFSGALFQKDEKVKAKWHGGRTYSAIIKGINKDGTYRVKYTDGDFDMAVPEKDILLPN
eukprot:1351021-Amorphochlora_amoeboformis.AAC.1